MMRFILVGILVLMAAGVGFLTFDWYRVTHGSGEAYGGPFTLVSDDNQVITQEAFRGQPSAVFFGFTHCPEVCPTTLFELDSWLASMGPEGERIRAYFVSVDPERDTPEVLDAYLSNLSGRITGITGEPENIADMLKDFGIFARKVETEDDYTMDHTASVLLLDRNGGFFGTIAYGEGARTAVAKLERLAKSG